ncbi:ribosome recycling factor-domain-containing protein [Podospora fimiseda]|uniref:Ribosome recycling factor-domain-containing protein n=1 Tax=Podospora fimiseda TaxID=252190 RepID=A0AAN7BQY8_9PEZI|nr:ribosome recycling factor-domain-containing protein [Podospora fimiseda]
MKNPSTPIMTSVRALNSIFRSNVAPIRAVSSFRSSLLLASKLWVPAEATAAQNQFPSISSSPNRPFSQSSVCQKKHKQVDEDDGGRRGKRRGGVAEEEVKSNKKDSSSSSSIPRSADGDQPVPSSENPFDFADITYAFDKAEKRYSEELRKLRSGGRFNAEVIGAIPVTLEKNSHNSFPLRELATVAPLGGRRWSILAFEEDSVKHIQAAVQRSPDFNQQPQRSEDNPLELIMTVELERADSLSKHAKDICQNWRNKIRDEAHKREAVHKKWMSDKVIVKDDLFKLREKMKKLQDDKMKVVLAKEKEVTAQIMAKAGHGV